MEILSNKLYNGSQIYSSGKIVVMRTNMKKNVFKLMKESMTSNVLPNTLDLRRVKLRLHYFWSCHEINFSIGSFNVCMNFTQHYLH
ncbi:LOW QUALITY PROTEIN: hypothetical protein V2J09_011225 [Rumex salicifolius]